MIQSGNWLEKMPLRILPGKKQNKHMFMMIIVWFLHDKNKKSNENNKKNEGANNEYHIRGVKT